jgi:DNA-binding NarL/FixJ family response regulator
MALTSNDREADIRRAIEAGIHGYLLLGGPLSELIEGVTTVANGVRYLGRAVAQRVADSLTRSSLTSRETEVLRLVTTGESNKAIARQLNIELATVKSHMTAIMTKLNATSRTQAADIAATRGLVAERVFARPAPLASRVGLIASPTQVA